MSIRLLFTTTSKLKQMSDKCNKKIKIYLNATTEIFGGKQYRNKLRN